MAEYYKRFGELTRDTGFFNIVELPPPLGAQDIIVPVEALAQREDGRAILISENQGCWTDEFMASSWAGEEKFTWVVRKGDRKKGPRQTPYTVGRPRAATPTKGQSVFEKLLARFR